MAAATVKNNGYQKEELRPLTSKFSSKFIDGASVEDQKELQEVWAKLLSNALDPNFKMQKIHPSFFDVIKTLTPVEVKLLNKIYVDLQKDKNWDKIPDIYQVTLHRELVQTLLNISPEEYNIAYRNLKRNELITSETTPLNGIIIDKYKGTISLGPDVFFLTPFGRDFIEACIA